MAGSRLALDILEDSALNNQPGQLKLYTRLALRLLELPPCPEQARLAKLYSPELLEVYQQEIQNRLADALPERRLGAWRTLLQLLYKGEAWAMEIAEASWPDSPLEAIHLIKACEGIEFADWLLERWAETIPQVPIAETHLGGSYTWQGISTDGLTPKFPDWLKYIVKYIESGKEEYCSAIVITFVSEERFALTLYMIPELNPIKATTEEKHLSIDSQWKWMLKALGYHGAYSKNFLVELLIEFQSWSIEQRKSLARSTIRLPWPLAACFRISNQRDNLHAIIEAASQGELGDLACWQQAEQRWLASGVSLEDYVSEFGEFPFDKNIDSRGFPFSAVGSRLSGSSIEVTMALFDAWKQLPRLNARAYLTDNIFFTAFCAGRDNETWFELSSAHILELAQENNPSNFYFEFVNTIPSHCWNEVEGIEGINLLGCKARIWSYDNIRHQTIQSLDNLAALHRDKPGILRLLSVGCVQGYKPTQFKIDLVLEQIAEPMFRSTAIIIKIAQADWSESESIKLAELIVGLGEFRDENVIQVATLIEKHEMKGRPVEVFLAKLYSLLPPTDWKLRQAIQHVMQEQQKRRLADAAALSL